MKELTSEGEAEVVIMAKSTWLWFYTTEMSS